MSRNRYSKRVDQNQPEIVKALRGIAGVSVELDHDDILVGYRGKTYWFEIKSDAAVGKAGKVLDSRKKKGQKKLESTYNGHYRIVSTLDEILEDIGIMA